MQNMRFMLNYGLRCLKSDIELEEGTHKDLLQEVFNLIKSRAEQEGISILKGHDDPSETDNKKYLSVVLYAIKTIQELLPNKTLDYGARLDLASVINFFKINADSEEIPLSVLGLENYEADDVVLAAK